MNIFKFLIFFFAGMYLLLCIAMYFLQRKLQYFPIASTIEEVERVGLKNLTVVRDGSSSVLAHFVVPATVAAPIERVVIVFHGNGGNALGRVWLLELFEKAGLSNTTATIFAEYRGYGVRHAEGEPTEAALISDALDTYDAVHAKWPDSKIVILGESLGTGVATALAAQRPVEKLILVSPFSSAVDVAAMAYPWLPVRLLMRDQFDSITRVAKITAPLFLVHGSDDRVVPIVLGQKLFESYSGKEKRMKVIPGVDHNDMPMSLINGKDDGDMVRFIGAVAGQP